MIIAAGLSPAWQQILVFDRLTRGEVNRAIETASCASGKVINVAVALATLGASSRTVSILGGRSGEMIAEELSQLGVEGFWVRDPAVTRTCTTIIERTTGEITELVENAPAIQVTACDEFFRVMREQTRDADWLVLSGSLPPISGRSSNRTLYRELIEMIGAGLPPGTASPRLIFDARGPEMVECLSLRPFLVKPNREELASTVGRSLVDDVALVVAMQELNERGAEWVLVTQGGGPVWLSSSTELWRFTPPRVEVVNAIGCGDCLTAGLAAALDRGDELPQAVCWGIASAGDNARQLLPARLDADRVRKLADQVVVERLCRSADRR